jgi:hypothetical protein
MEYKHVNGRVLSRYAFTPPVVNSEPANAYGIDAPSSVPLDEGSNVKLRVVLDNLSQRMTCHARVDRVAKDETSGAYAVAFGQLSFSDDEFEILLRNCVDQPPITLEFGRTVRGGEEDTEPGPSGRRAKRSGASRRLPCRSV